MTYPTSRGAYALSADEVTAPFKVKSLDDLKSPKYDDRIPSSNGNDKADLITVKDIAEATMQTTTIEYKLNDSGKFVEVCV